MTDRAALLARIESAIARKRFSEQAAAVLAELERDHVLVERGRWARIMALVRPFPNWMDTDDRSKEFAMAEDEMIRAYLALQPDDLDDSTRDEPMGTRVSHRETLL